MSDPNLQDQMARLVSGYWYTQTIYVAVKLGIAELLKDGPRSAQELADATGTNPRALYRLLRALASIGIFAEEAGRFSLSPPAECLLDPSAKAMATMRGDFQYRAWGELLYSVQTGESAFEKVYGKPIFDFFAENPEPGKLFDQAMTGVHLERAHFAQGEHLQRLAELASHYYEGLSVHDSDFFGLCVSADQFAEAVRVVEARAVGEAKKRLVEPEAEHKKLTVAWVKASEMMQTVMKEELDRMEQEIKELRPRTISLSQRVEKIARAERRRKEKEQIIAEWPKMESRESGEAFRRMFKTVTLFWDRTFHPASKKPTKPRTTKRS